MREINIKDLSLIEGGMNVSGTLINALTSGIKIILEVGRCLGSVIRRGSNGDVCKI